MSEHHPWYAVCNAEGQYSVWHGRRPVPAGWDPVFQAPTKEECLEHIEQVWTDIRPLSSR